MVKLYDYQKDAINRLSNGSILCAGVGTGKSIMALMYYRKLSAKAPLKLYIITTARKRDSGEWLSDINKCNMDVRDVVVDSWNNIGKYLGVKGAFVIFDEQRAIGAGAWAKAFIKIAKANRWIVLSATPGDNWVDYIPVFIANGFYRNRTAFNSEHVVFDRYSRYPKIAGYRNVSKLLMYKKAITVYVSHVNQSVERVKETVEFSYDTRKYFDILKRRWDPWKSQPIEDAAGLCYCLRRVCNESTERLEKIRELYEEHDRIIVFYNFNYELEMLISYCDSEGICCAEWNGHVHEAVPGEDQWIYLVQYSSGAEGWNCITADTIVFFSLTYSFKTLTQAAGRIDRLNTPYEKLYYYYFQTKSSIDKQIGMALDTKGKFNENRFYEEAMSKGEDWDEQWQET